MKSTRHLRDWGFVTVGGAGPVVCGSEGIRSLRVSTPIIEFDPETRLALTSSQRPYELHGPEQPTRALEIFRSFYTTHLPVAAVSPEHVMDVVRANGNRPFELSSPEDADARAARLLEIGGKVAQALYNLETLHGVNIMQIAASTGAPLHEVQRLVEGEPSESMSVPAAEKILETVELLLNDPDIADAYGQRGLNH